VDIRAVAMTSTDMQPESTVARLTSPLLRPDTKVVPGHQETPERQHGQYSQQISSRPETMNSCDYKYYRTDKASIYFGMGPIAIEMRTGFACQLTEDRTMYILWLGVAPHERRRGIGTSIVNQIIAMALMLGAERLVTTPSGEGIHFWPKMGFVETKPDAIDSEFPLKGLIQ